MLKATQRMNLSVLPAFPVAMGSSLYSQPLESLGTGTIHIAHQDNHALSKQNF